MRVPVKVTACVFFFDRSSLVSRRMINLTDIYKPLITVRKEEELCAHVVFAGLGRKYLVPKY